MHGDVAARSVMLADGDVCKLRLKLNTLLELRNKLPESLGEFSHTKWAAPEVIDTGEATFRSDVWSFGIFLWELGTYSTVFPYDGWNLARTQKELKSGYRLPKLLGMLDDFYAVLRLCWSRVPSERSTPEELAPLLDKVADDFQAAKIRGIGATTNASHLDGNSLASTAPEGHRAVFWHRAEEVVNVSNGPPPVPARTPIRGGSSSTFDGGGGSSGGSDPASRDDSGNRNSGGGGGEAEPAAEEEEEDEESLYVVMELTGENPFDRAASGMFNGDADLFGSADADANRAEGASESDVDEDLAAVERQILKLEQEQSGQAERVSSASPEQHNASNNSNPFADELRAISGVGGDGDSAAAAGRSSEGGSGAASPPLASTNPFATKVDTNPFSSFMSEANAKGLDAEDVFEAMAEINIGPSEGRGDPEGLLEEVPIYHGHINRAEAEARLTAHGVMGAYLVRARDQACTSFAFSQLGKGMTVVHSKIDYLADSVLIDGHAGALLQGAPLQEVVAAALWKREHLIIGMGSSSARSVLPLYFP